MVDILYYMKKVNENYPRALIKYCGKENGVETNEEFFICFSLYVVDLIINSPEHADLNSIKLLIEEMASSTNQKVYTVYNQIIIRCISERITISYIRKNFSSHIIAQAEYLIESGGR